MEAYDTPEQVKARQAKFSRMARLQAIKEETRRRTALQTDAKKTRSTRLNDVWNTDVEEKDLRRDDIAYAIPYIEEFRAGPKPDSQLNDSQSVISQVDDDAASTITASTTATVTDIATQLAFLKTRGPKPTRKIYSSTSGDQSYSGGVIMPSTSRPAPPSPSVCTYDFEKVSTVQAPTEIAAEGIAMSERSIDDLRQRYFQNYETSKSLPIYRQRKQIIDSINSYSVVIIEGSTGCGKTTQVPTYILEDTIVERPARRAPVIYVTQPRKIAARSIAERVCSEHNWPLASLVGYQVSLDKACGPDTVLVFCTAGVLLQKIIQEKSLKNYTHIIIDEAHERDSDTDLLMMMIRKLMFVEMPVFRLVIMSATMDIDKLKRYYTFKTHYGHLSETTPSYIHVGQSERLTSQIQTVYLDILRSSFGVCEKVPDFDLEAAELYEDCLRAAVKIIIEVVPRLDNYSEKAKSTLVFLPGLAEISKLDRMIRAYDGAEDCFDIIPLHSCLTVLDQYKVFQESRPGTRKIILATNIAESSITVPDVGFIVDFCLTKSVMKDPITRFPTLKLQWCTQDKCIQRSGRTGRCCPGKVFRMVPNSFFRQFEDYAKPELLTAPLEISVLRVKNFMMGEIKGLFALVMDPPPYNEIKTAVLELKQIGALSACFKGHLSDIDGDLTELGRVISCLPIDVHLSKLIVIAGAFDVIDDAIIVAACLSTNRTVVRYMYGNLYETYDNKLEWSKGSQSDLFVSLDCYKEFKEYKDDKGKTDKWLASWCASNHLDERKLHEVDAMAREIANRLESINILVGIEQPNRERDVNVDNLMLKVAFCSAFYPNYFLTENLDPDRIMKELNGCFDPTRTVYLAGIPTSQVPIYKSQLIKRIEEGVSTNFDFMADCSRAYLVFNDNKFLCPEGSKRVAEAIEDETHGVIQKSRVIPKSVYKALKMGEFDDINIREYRDDIAMKRMEFYDNQREEFASIVGRRRLVPACMKVLSPGEQADNRDFYLDNDEDYMDHYQQKPYFEVEFDEEQDKLDQHELYELELSESKQNEKNLNHGIFKPEYRRVRGPDNPIKMTFRSVLMKSRGFNVEIDRQSVNSVLLDPEYLEGRRQMLVAASVAQAQAGHVSARDTTLMPNIRGLPTLMALLFAQYYRLIYNQELKCPSGGVFGIGWSDRDQPLDRNYEVELAFDVHLNLNDLELVNKARKMMSQLLKFTEVQNAGAPQHILQERLRDTILALMRRKRLPLAELDISVVDTDTNKNIFLKDVHNMEVTTVEEGKTQPFMPLMKYTKEYSEVYLYERVRSNLNLLEKIDKDEEPMPLGGVKCLVCGNGQTFCFVKGLSVGNHLQTDQHKKKKAEFEIFEKHIRQLDNPS